VSGVERYIWNETLERYLSLAGAGTGLVPAVLASDHAAAVETLSRRVAELEGAVTAHVADLEKVAAIFREAGMTESADETDAAVAELRAALKGQG
jgi:glycine cleavage system regulatory protein